MGKPLGWITNDLRALALAVAIVVTLTPSLCGLSCAYADGAATPTLSPVNNTLTWRPIDLLQSTLAVHWERLLRGPLSLTARLAAGKYRTDQYDSIVVVEPGLQAAGYFLGDFYTGLRVGLDLRMGWNWAHGDRNLSGHNKRIRSALMLGGKWTSKSSITAELEVGIALQRSWGVASSPIDRIHTDATALAPHVGLGLGKSF